MSRIIMISDIHGCSKTFLELLNKISFSKTDKLYLLGDYIDRGLDSKGVLDHIMDLMEKGYQVFPLRGNHEAMLLNNYNLEVNNGWSRMADDELLESFAIPNLKKMPKRYIDFCNSLDHYYLEEDFIAVHAGLSFDLADPFEDRRNMLWIREWYATINYEWLGNRIIVHGHTPQTKYEIQQQFEEVANMQVLNIDCGACLSRQKQHGLGYLCVFDFTNQELIFQANIEERNVY